MLQRPILPTPIIGFNQYHKHKEDLKLQELRNFREMIQRKFPQTGIKDAMLEPLKTPEM